MYYIVLIFVTALLGFACITGGSIGVFIDPFSLILLLLITSLLTTASGLFVDFMRGFKVVTAKKNIYTSVELKKTALSIKMVQFTLLLTGIVTGLLGKIQLLHLVSEANTNSSNAVALLVLFYSLIIILLLTPINFKIKSSIIELENKNCED